MEPLIFGPQPPRKPPKSKQNRSSHFISSPSPKSNGSGVENGSGTSTQSIHNGHLSSPDLSNGHKSPSNSRSPRSEIIAEKVSNISKIQLPNSRNNSISSTTSEVPSVPMSGYDGNSDGYTSINGSGSGRNRINVSCDHEIKGMDMDNDDDINHRELEIKDINIQEVNDLMNDIWRY